MTGVLEVGGGLGPIPGSTGHKAGLLCYTLLGMPVYLRNKHINIGHKTLPKHRIMQIYVSLIFIYGRKDCLVIIYNAI